MAHALSGRGRIPVRIAGLTRALPGESHNGDAFFLARLGQDLSHIEELFISGPDATAAPPAPVSMELAHGEAAFLAVVDGLGHGSGAAAATARVLECLRQQSRADLISLAGQCHRAARASRGATIALVLLRPAQARVDHLGVGDVKTQLAVWHEGLQRMSLRTLVNNNGTVGYRIPAQLNTMSCDFSPGDMLLLSSDGIAQDIDPTELPRPDLLNVEAVAAAMLGRHALSRDDATIVVAR